MAKTMVSWQAFPSLPPSLPPCGGTIEPLRMNKRDELYSLCNLYLLGGLFFLVATPYHVIPYNFRLLFHSSIYSAVYSWFFLINMMKTGIGQSKYCVPQPFSRCLISLCSSLFYFNSIYVGVNFLSQVILIFLLFQLH